MYSTARGPWLVVFTLFFSAMTGCAPVTSVHDSRPIAVDQDHNVHIPAPDHLVRQLRLAVLYNEDEIQFRFEVPTDSPSWYHQYWVYEDRQWVRYGAAPVGPQEHGLYEDRIAMMLDDGSVPSFARYGGFIVSHPGIRGRTDAIDADETRAHPWIGQELGESEVHKFIPDSRGGDEREPSWDQVLSSDQLDRLRDEGRFIDSIQWRAHRSNPVGFADNGYVLEHRHSGEGTGPYFTNWSQEHSRPALMFDPEQVGFRALLRSKLLAGEYTQDDLYYLREDQAVTFDDDHQWQEGDVIPHRILRPAEGSRGAVTASGRWRDGAWHVQWTRALEAINPRDSKTIDPQQTYRIAVAAHLDATGGRWHYVSMPLTVRFEGDQPGLVQAQHVEGSLDDAEVERWTTVPVFYPGQITYAQLQSGSHPAAVILPLARENPLNPGIIRSFADALVDHELMMLENDR
ncbi:MAG: hypothetical protein JJU36_17970 [Phycisphaeraceae bacterium]|nr:hypothetical protein [Phycisphaeraceae bacterium]